MPYVNAETRRGLDPAIAELASLLVKQEVGALNYAITSLVDAWAKEFCLSYECLNAAIGVLECAKLEMYRRVAAPYEDRKRVVHGEVYAPDRVYS